MRHFAKQIFVSIFFKFSLSAPVSAGAVAEAQQALNLLGFNAGALKGSHGKNASRITRVLLIHSRRV